MRCYRAALLAFVLACLSFAAALPAFARQVVIFTSHDYISRNYEIQHFVDTLTLEEGQLELPLTLTIHNGSPESPSFKWFRIVVNGEIIATEMDMRGREMGCKDVSGILHGSNLQIQIEAGGVPGANLWFTLSTGQMELTAVEPANVLPGQQFRVAGSNIPASPDLLSVNIGGRQAKVISAAVDAITVQMPEAASPGPTSLQVRSGKQVSNPLALTVASRPVPEILGIDCWMAPPGGTINISGRNFSANAAEDRVFFDKVQAQVLSASSNQLAVVVPEWPYGPSQLNIPITVEVNGQRSCHSYPFDIGPSYHGDIPQFGQR